VTAFLPPSHWRINAELGLSLTLELLRSCRSQERPTTELLARGRLFPPERLARAGRFVDFWGSGGVAPVDEPDAVLAALAPENFLDTDEAETGALIAADLAAAAVDEAVPLPWPSLTGLTQR
jgi:hypothetical protein